MIPGQQEKPITSRAEDIYIKLKEFNDAANEFAFNPYSPDLMHRCQMKCSELSGLADNKLKIKVTADNKEETEKLQDHLLKVKTFIELKYENLKINAQVDEVADVQKEGLRLYSEYDRLLLFSEILK